MAAGDDKLPGGGLIGALSFSARRCCRSGRSLAQGLGINQRAACRRLARSGPRAPPSLPVTLWDDFVQTFLKCGACRATGDGRCAGFIVAILVDRSPFLKRGMLPIGNFASALPIIGIAPIMVMWFGFDWRARPR